MFDGGQRRAEIELVYQAFSGYHDKMLTWHAGGVTPDVMAVSRLYVPNFADQGVIQPIDPWFNEEDDTFVNNIFETVSGTYMGKLYGIPIWGGPIVAEYNADFFDLAGLEQPVDLAQRNEWTWDTFIAQGKKITQDTTGDGIFNQFMHGRLGTRAADWYLKMRSMGADIISPEGEPFTDVGAIENALRFWSEFATEHHISPLPGESSGFIAGTEAVYFTWISDVPNHYTGAADKFKFEIASPPIGPAGQFTLAGGVPIAISATTKHAKEAYDFARWYAMESRHWEIRGMPSGLDELATDYREYMLQFVSWPEAIMHSMGGTYSMEPGVGPYRVELEQAWNPVLLQVSRGEISPHEGALRLVESTKRITGK